MDYNNKINFADNNLHRIKKYFKQNQPGIP